jgi:hypothetical protein
MSGTRNRWNLTDDARLAEKTGFRMIDKNEIERKGNKEKKKTLAEQ